MADQCRQVSVYYGTKACGWNPRFLHSFEPKGLSGREREGKTDKRSTVCVDGSPKIDPSSCRVDQMRTIHGGVFRLIKSTLHMQCVQQGDWYARRQFATLPVIRL